MIYKINTKISPELLFLLHAMMRSEIQTLKPKGIRSQNQEIFEKLAQSCKTYMQNPNGKVRTLSLWHHQWERLFAVIVENLDNPHLGVFERNQLEMIKNELHQKIL